LFSSQTVMVGEASKGSRGIDTECRTRIDVTQPQKRVNHLYTLLQIISHQ